MQIMCCRCYPNHPAPLSLSRRRRRRRMWARAGPASGAEKVELRLGGRLFLPGRALLLGALDELGEVEERPFEDGGDGAVIARPEQPLDSAAHRLARDRVAGEHVVEAPAD